jgi:hypothetical protein
MSGDSRGLGSATTGDSSKFKSEYASGSPLRFSSSKQRSRGGRYARQFGGVDFKDAMSMSKKK